MIFPPPPPPSPSPPSPPPPPPPPSPSPPSPPPPPPFLSYSLLHSFSILNSCWVSEPNQRPSFELLHETLHNIFQRNDCSQLVEVTTIHVDELAPQASSGEERPGQTANSPTSESSDSAISEVERMSASPDGVQTMETKLSPKVPSADLPVVSTATDLDSHSKGKPASEKDSPLTGVPNVAFFGGEPLPEMNPDGSTEI